MGSSPLMSSTPTWDSPTATWDSAGATWDATPTPPAPKPKKRPFHRSPKPNIPTPPLASTTMPTFKFTISPKSTGGYRTSAVLGSMIDETALTAMIATACGTTPEQTTLVIKTFLAKLRECANGCSWSPNLYGELGVRPTSGGSSPAPDGFQNADEINADVALSFTAEVIQQWRSGLTLESQGTKGLVTPVIDTVLCLQNNAEDHYVVGDNIRLYGHSLRFDKADPAQGIFFIKADGSEVRASVYGPVNPSDVTVLVPAGLTGSIQLRISAHINGSLRTYLYTRPLT